MKIVIEYEKPLYNNPLIYEKRAVLFDTKKDAEYWLNIVCSNTFFNKNILINENQPFFDKRKI